MRSLIFIFLHLTAGIVPFVQQTSISTANLTEFPGWPSSFDGKTLIQLPFSPQETGFTQGFPGKIGRFTDQHREIIIRYVEQPTRKLHPSSDCLQGSGYQVKPQPINRDKHNQLWGCVLAEKGAQQYRVCERIYDNDGKSWYDASSWFWSTLLKQDQGPWWAVTVAELLS